MKLPQKLILVECFLLLVLLFATVTSCSRGPVPGPKAPEQE
jgi:hypothetical protein